MNKALKVVLVSRSGYSAQHDHLLQSLIGRRIKLFCVIGRDCQLWEDIMDELVVGLDGEGDLDLITTSHKGKSVEEVIAFAESWNLNEPTEVQVIEI
jgi:hypothetical protein